MKSKKLLIVLAFFLLTACQRQTSSVPPISSDDTFSSEMTTYPDETGIITLEVWTSYGQLSSNVVIQLLENFEEKNTDVQFNYQTFTPNSTLSNAIINGVETNNVPHLVIGSSNIMLDLSVATLLPNLANENYINNANYPLNLKEYYEPYLSESASFHHDERLSLPLNQSSEVMNVNETFFNVAALFDPTIKVPTTWQDLSLVGPKLKAVAQNNGWFGKVVLRTGEAISEEQASYSHYQDQIAFNFVHVNASTFIPFMWHSPLSLFSTVLRQYGATYTSRDTDGFHGYIRFHDQDNIVKTKEALAMVKGLIDARVLGIPASYPHQNAIRETFKYGNALMSVGSHQLISEQIATVDPKYPMVKALYPHPYNDNNPLLKYTLQSGNNIALLNRRDQSNRQKESAWRVLRYLSSEVNHDLNRLANAFPVINGAKLKVDNNDPRYNDYLRYKTYLETPQNIAYNEAVRQTALLTTNTYLNSENGWKPYENPAFIDAPLVDEIVTTTFSTMFTQNKSVDDVLDTLTNNLLFFIEE